VIPPPGQAAFGIFTLPSQGQAVMTLPPHFSIPTGGHQRFPSFSPAQYLFPPPLSSTPWRPPSNGFFFHALPRQGENLFPSFYPEAEVVFFFSGKRSPNEDWLPSHSQKRSVATARAAFSPQRFFFSLPSTRCLARNATAYPPFLRSTRADCPAQAPFPFS